jgi:hypothetical protein
MCSNPSVCVRTDGTIEMVYKGVATQKPLPFGGPVVHIVATADSPTGPFRKNEAPVFTQKGVTFPAEDPFIWCDGKNYWAVVKDMQGYFTTAGRSLALMKSLDGFTWEPAAHALVSRTEFQRVDGTLLTLDALERPQIWFDGAKPAVLFCAASITMGGNAPSTFNVAIPLRSPGRTQL